MTSFYDDKICFDIETSGTDSAYSLQPWRVAQGKSWITSLVWMRRRNGVAEVNGRLDPGRDDMAAMLETAIRDDLRIVGHNVVFDIAWLLAYDLRDLVFKAKFLDSMLLWKQARVEPEFEAKGRPGKRKSYGLKACVAELWPDQAGYEENIDFHDQSAEARTKLFDYNVRDVVFTFRAAHHWWKELTPKQQNCALIESECLALVADTNLRGALVDTLHLNHLRAELVAEAEQALAQLEPHGVTEQVIRSPKQLRKVMFEDWGLTPIKQTGAGADSTDKESLHEIAISSGDPRVKLLRTYRENLNAIAKFVDSPLKAAEYNEDGYARPQFIVFSAYTGRFTVSSKQKHLTRKRKMEEVQE